MHIEKNKKETTFEQSASFMINFLALGVSVERSRWAKTNDKTEIKVKTMTLFCRRSCDM